MLKDTNQPIGTSTALQREKLEFIDIGYAFLSKGRGKGYASEATKLIIEYVRKKFQQEKVYAFTMPKNKASQKLLEKLGFKYIGVEKVFENSEDFVFEYVF